MRTAVWVVLAVEAFVVVFAVAGAARTKSDAAGRGLAQAYGVLLGVFALLLLVPAALFNGHGHHVTGLVLALSFLLPVAVLVLAG